MFGAWEAFAWDVDDNKGYVTNDDYPTKDVSKTYPVSLSFVHAPSRSFTTDDVVVSYIFVIRITSANRTKVPLCASPPTRRR